MPLMRQGQGGSRRNEGRGGRCRRIRGRQKHAGLERGLGLGGWGGLTSLRCNCVALLAGEREGEGDFCVPEPCSQQTGVAKPSRQQSHRYDAALTVRLDLLRRFRGGATCRGRLGNIDYVGEYYSLDLFWGGRWMRLGEER